MKGRVFIAIKVLDEVINLTLKLALSSKDNLEVETYSNGREQGFAITNFSNTRKVCFSECKNSDNIILYKGTYLDFSMTGNVPSEETYKAGMSFRYDQITETAIAAVEYLLLIKIDREKGNG